MPRYPMPYGTRKKNSQIGRDKAPIKSDCIACKSSRSVTLTVTKNVLESRGVGRCSECGYTSFVTSLAQDEFTILGNGAVLRRVHENDPDYPLL